MILEMLTYAEGLPFFQDKLDDFDYLNYFFESDDVFVFVENGEIIGTAYLVFDPVRHSVYIGNIDACKERAGYGKKIIQYLMESEEVDMIEGEASEIVLPFFQKFGAVIGAYDHGLEGFGFFIDCTKERKGEMIS